LCPEAVSTTGADLQIEPDLAKVEAGKGEFFTSAQLKKR